MNENLIPDPARPLMMQRLRLGHEAPEIWRRLFPVLKRNRECCDEVWFSTGVGFPPLEEHRRTSELIASHAYELRSIGIIPSLQVQATLGHSDAITGAYGAEGKTWGSYVGIHGEECRYINCPRQPGFLAYLREMSRIYAAWHPGSVWIDDDLRLGNHRPAWEASGCCCPYCLELFSKEVGRKYTREEIEAAFENDTELKERWLDFAVRGLSSVAETIVKAFMEISPETRFGLQHNSDPIRNVFFDVIRKVSNARPGSRPGGGAYSDHNPYAILDKALLMSLQMAEQAGYETLGQICPEIESCPRNFCCKTSQGHRIESLLYLAMGTDSLSYFIMDPVYETPEWYGRELLEPLAAEAPCYRKFIQHNQGTMPGGLGIAGYQGGQALGLPLIGIPLAAYSPYAACTMLTKKAAENLPESNLRELLERDVLLDGAAAEALQKRGLSSLLSQISVRPLNEMVFDYYSDAPLNQGLEAPKHYPLSEERYTFDLPDAIQGKAHILSSYKDAKGNDFGIATVLLERENGTRLALIGYDGFNTTYVSSTRVRFLNRIADWCAHGKMPALADEPVQCLIVPRISCEGQLRSVTVLNATIGCQKPFSLRLRHIPDNAKAFWQVPGSAPIEINLEQTRDDWRATLPQINPWDIGWLKIAP